MTLNTLVNNAVGTIVVPGDWSIGDGVSTEIALYGHIAYEDASRIVLDIK